MRNVSPEAAAEIRRIADAGGGLVQARAVHEAARSSASPLHGYFCWDDTAAAERFRLQQAGELIVRVSVEVVADRDRSVTTRAFVSLASDRQNRGGGFRDVHVVMADPALRGELLRTALSELNALRARYAHLVELAGVFDALAAAEQQRAG